MNLYVQQDELTSSTGVPEEQDGEDELEGAAVDDGDAASESALDVSGSSDTPMDMDLGHVGGPKGEKQPPASAGAPPESGPDHSGDGTGSQGNLGTGIFDLRKDLVSEKKIIANIHRKIHNSSVTVDNVFDDHPSGNCPAGGAGSGSRVGGLQAHTPAPVFPPTYNILRAGKLKKMAATRLPNSYGVNRVPAVGSGPPGGLAIEGDMRPFNVQNYHSNEKGLNVSFSIARPEAGSDSLNCLGCAVTHSFGVRMAEKGLPILVILSDQNFPAVLPSEGGLCPVIVRVEDGTLGEIADAFLDRFNKFVSPHGNLPPGSVILIGSISHMRAVGVGEYCEALVGVSHRLGTRVGRNVDIVPLVGIPLHGVGEVHVLRDLLDLDAWLASCARPVGTTLPATRTLFWKMVYEGGEGDYPQEVRTVTLPSSLKNSRKRAFITDPPCRPLPLRVDPFSTSAEGKIVTSLLKEINDVYGLGMDPNPDLSREMDPPPCHDQSRTVLFGSSHVKRLAGHMADDAKVIDLSVPGWTANKDAIGLIANELKELALTGEDTVVLDLLSNSSYMGTDDSGIPSRPVKLAEDKTYHIVGELQVAPESAFRKIIRDCQPIFEAVSCAKKIALLPFPRYLSGKCCSNPEHITNFGNEEYKEEVLRVSSAVRSAYNSVKPPGEFVIYSLSDSDLLHTATADDPGDIWRDPVHFRGTVYAAIAADLLVLIGAAAAEEPGALPAKRQRLDSVAPPVICTAPQTRGQVPTPGWLMGVAVQAQQGRGGWGRGRGSGGAGGRRGGRSGWRGSGRASPYSWRGWSGGYAGGSRARGRGRGN